MPLVVVLSLSRTAWAGGGALPQGDEGIAANYPDDAGIGGDPQVYFADDFEGYADASGLPDRWDAAVYQVDQTRIATEPENVYGGSQSVEFTVPQQDAELSNAIDKVVSPELDVLYLRYYSKFQGPYDIVGSSHNGSMISSHYFDNGQATPGVPADGTNKWLAGFENWRGEAETASPGLLNIYIYHPEQRSNYGDHFWADGTITPYDPDPPPDYFGPDFVPRDNIIPTLDQWHCYEYMVQANTPGERDGRIAFWYDGMLAADFGNLRLRDTDALTIDRFGLAFHIGSNPDAIQRKWYDDVVAAHAYIGPKYQGGATDDTGTDGGSDGGSADGDGSATADGTASASASGSASDSGGGTDGQGASAGEASFGEGGSEGGSGAEDDDDGGGCGCGVASNGWREIVLGWLWVAAWLPRRRR